MNIARKCIPLIIRYVETDGSKVQQVFVNLVLYYFHIFYLTVGLSKERLKRVTLRCC